MTIHGTHLRRLALLASLLVAGIAAAADPLPKLPPDHTFKQGEGSPGKVTFSHDGFEDFIDEFQFYVSDGMAVSGIQTAHIDVTPVNDQPFISTVPSLKVLEGASIVLGASVVSSNDVDGGGDKSTGYAATNTLSYTVSTLPVHGEVRLEVAGKTYDPTDPSTYVVAGVGTVVTQADLDRVRQAWQQTQP